MVCKEPLVAPMTAAEVADLLHALRHQPCPKCKYQNPTEATSCSKCGCHFETYAANQALWERAYKVASVGIPAVVLIVIYL